MKIYIYLWIISMLLSIGLGGCKDWIDLKPENSLVFKNAFESERDVEAALLGVEQSVRVNMTAASWTPQTYGEYSDYHDNQSFALLIESQAWAYVSQWHWNYNVIAAANVALPYIDDVDMPQERRDFYKGSMFFFKAFAYLDLLRRWGDCVLIQDEIETGPIGKTPWSAVADYAIAQAREAVCLLPEWNELRDTDGNAITHRARPCKGAANAVLAHLCAWKAGCKYLAQSEERNYDEQSLWRTVDSACSAIIARTDIYALEATPDEVCTRTLLDGGKECVFESIFHGYWEEMDSQAQYNSICLGQTYESYPVITGKQPGDIKMSYNRILNTTVRAMFEEYEENGEIRHDTRRDAWFYNFEEMERMDESITGGYAYPYKWRYGRVSTEGWDAGQFINFDCNKIWFRLADIYLLRAECRARLNDRQGAIDDLNKIRDRAGAKRYDGSEYNGDLRYAIFKEREKELLMEGQRWFDVLRNGYYKTELYGGFREVSEQDIVDGVFFNALDEALFTDNPLIRQNTYWLKRQ